MLQTNPTVEAGPAVTGHLFSSASDLLQLNLAPGNWDPSFNLWIWVLFLPIAQPLSLYLVSFFWL